MHNDRRPANNNRPMLTLERAIADGLDPASLRMTADWSARKKSRRSQQQAEHLHSIADKLEILGYGRAA